MPPSQPSWLTIRQNSPPDFENWDWRAGASDEDFVVESWSEGFMVGSLIIMAAITIANMRRRVLLHKLILAEQLLAMSHGTFCFMSFPGYGWYLSSTAALLYSSWVIHNVVAWMKVRPFFSQPGGFFKLSTGIWTERIYLGSLALTIPAIAVQISNNFRYFNHRGGYYREFRPFEPLYRDPWWIFTCVALFHVVRRCYGSGFFDLIRKSPRFGILLLAIFLSVVFTICDIVASATAFVGIKATSTDGINPWWKLSLVFKALTDTILLDDFKTELKRLAVQRIHREERQRNSIALVADHDLNNYLSPDNSMRFQDQPDPVEVPKRRYTWYGKWSSTSGSDADAKKNVLHSNRIVRQANKQPPMKAKDGANGIDFETALTLGPSGLAEDHSSQHVQHADRSPDQPQGRNHINDDRTKISQLPNLHVHPLETIKPARKSYGSTDSDDEEIVRDTAVSSTARSQIPISNLRSTRIETDLTKLHDRELEEAKRRSERVARERRFRQSLGATDYP